MTSRLNISASKVSPSYLAVSTNPAQLASKQLTRVYGHSHGWKMFDSRYLTPAVRTHLTREVDGLNAILAAFPGYQRFVEVGCGYGRLLEWSIGKGLCYDGLDLVSWIVHLGQIRTRRVLARYPRAQASIHCLPAEAVDTLFPPCSFPTPALLLFPFNCLGNVRRIADVLAAVARTPCDVIVSTFNTRAETTAARIAYYAACGFSQFESEKRQEGTLIRSMEGLHTWAYSDAHYCAIFDHFGFSLATVQEAGRHGHLLYFRNRTPGCRAVSVMKGHSAVGTESRQLSTGKVSIRLHALMGDAAQGRPPRADGSCLLTFDASQPLAAWITDDMLSVEIDRNWQAGTAVYVEIVYPGTRELIQFAAVVKQALRKAGERYQTTLRLVPSYARSTRYGFSI